MSLYARVISFALYASIALTMPLWPLMLTIMTGQFKHTRRYFTTIRKGFTHYDALLKNRAVQRYFSEGTKVPKANIAENIGGFCNHCGQCCLERRCMFLEQKNAQEYLCGIYGTWLRDHTYCGAYPINQIDLDLYNCPTYYVIKPETIKKNSARSS